ncbi:hypothetical protein [Acinetobacter sp. TSRC1-2]|uniref:hypothetical protein n=1 Tax=unclassified Acinetobacter TaxID=196816 RepID=UPI003CF47295
MDKNANFHLLEQVYNFLVIRPGFKVKKSGKIIRFSTKMHQVHEAGIRFDSPSKIIMMFRSRKIVNIDLSPSLRNKTDFLEWVYKQLNS